ncbi:MAG: phospho-N-acetylmuramoyl-pentapeptide-transferase [Clostridia bacterium]|nr:phospho-N-acetylmuramoyl-pentapeptide-transferase [Clostridia bacterium]
MKLYIGCVIAAFFVSLLFCALSIPILRRFKAGQNILSYVKEHKKKSGTPTMGGLAFITAAVLTAILFVRSIERTFLLAVAIGLSYMVIGLLDDLMKKKHRQNLGLKAWQKFSFQLIVAIFAGIYCKRADLTVLNIPFAKTSMSIGGWILPLSVFVFVATVNAVNLTDGLDGLAAGACVPYFATLGVLIVLQKGNTTLATLSMCLMGALIAYLLFNAPPASVFMGDTGSLALGGFAAAIALFSGNALYIVAVGIVFVFSVISVIVQVIYYKATKGKRVFLMAPIHHHFQMKGYSESKISYAYFVITLVLGLLCVTISV